MHLDGINRSLLRRTKGIGAANVERYFQHGLKRQFTEWHLPPSVLGIDEHFFTRRKGYATTFCNLKNHKIYDVVLGRSELSLGRKHFPNALIVGDRFHVIRLINQHSLACWREIGPAGVKHRGLSLLRRHRHNLKPEQQVNLSNYLTCFPVLEPIYTGSALKCVVDDLEHEFWLGGRDSQTPGSVNICIFMTSAPTS